MNLYQISTEYQLLLDQTFDPETGEINELALTSLNEVKESMEKKAVALASYIKNIDAEREAIANAKKEMDRREKSLDKKMEYLSTYLRENMERCGISEVKCPYFQIRLKNNPVSVEAFDEDVIPDEYKKQKVTYMLDKIKLKDELQAGVVIEGVRLKQNKRLEIR